MTSEPEVLIAGAGPTGLTLACGLLANGVAARVVDKAVEPAGTSRHWAFSREVSRWWSASVR
jgi:2-polyprenyl-6-methoxyphenol hydroxylase-like FAD-dependent oxidoreductase